MRSYSEYTHWVIQLYMSKYGLADYKKVSNSTSSLLATILLKFSAAIVFTYKNLSTLRIDSCLLLNILLLQFTTIVTVRHISSNIFNIHASVKGNYFQLGDKITQISRT